MTKTLVCILEDEMIMNYLFIKELYEIGDKLILITQQKQTLHAERFRRLFSNIKEVQIIALEKDGDEDLWDKICRTIRRKLPQENQNYYVNLSSGTRLLSIAVQQVFERFKARFFFMPLDRNVIIESHIDDDNDNDDDIVCEIGHRVSIGEYLQVSGVTMKSKQPMQSEEYSSHFFEMFSGKYFSDRDFDILEELRNSRNDTVRIASISGLDKFLRYINFENEDPAKLSAHEVQYLTGGWFEEYIYHTIKRIIQPSDISIGVCIQREGSRSQNDLDVVFTLNNRLFVIECKTGVGRLALFNQIVYKACALKDELLGIRCNSYIFSLNEDEKNNLKTIARNMGIAFCDRSYADEPLRLKNLFLNTKLYL